MNLNDLTKPVLVEMTKIIEGQAGDYARLTKDHYVSLLSEKDPFILTEAYEKVMSAEQQGGQQPQPKPQQPQRPLAFNDSAVQQLLGALGTLVKPTLDEEQIRAIVSVQVADAVANMAPRVERVIVTEKAEINLGEEHLHPVFNDVLPLVGIRENVLLVGPAGTGKTHMAEQVARALNLPFASISCTAGMSESQMLGWMLPTGESGRFEYVESEFVRLYENGGVFLFDEIDAADPNVLMVINQALANGGFFVPQRVGRPFVKRHKDFVCIAAANTFGHGGDMMYAGRERLDAATLDRFTMIEVGYDEALEEKAVHPDLLAWRSHMRAKVAENRLRRVISTRRLISMTRQIAAGIPMTKVLEYFFRGWTKDEKSKVGAV